MSNTVLSLMSNTVLGFALCYTYLLLEPTFHTVFSIYTCISALKIYIVQEYVATYAGICIR